jgi:putative hemolysin
VNEGALVVAAASSVAAAVLSAVDGALLGVDPAPGSRAPAGVPAIADRERAHRAVAFGRMIAYLGTGAAIAEALGLSHLSGGSSWAVAVLAVVGIVAVVEGVARPTGHALGSRLLLRLAPVVAAVETVLALPLNLAAFLDRRLGELLPSPADQHESREMSSERFRQVVAAEAGVSSAEEALLRGAFSLGETAVREIMVPRVDVIGVDADTPWSEVVDRVRSSEHARLPVYEETLDNITGILYAKDLLPAVIADEPPASGWRSLIRPSVFIPAFKAIDQQLRDFQASGTHMAIVVDEFGGTAGIVTIEDVLEEIVGEIQDEHDVEEPDVEQEEGRRFWVAGRVTVDELSALLGSDFEVDGVTTVGGYLYTLFGRVPRAGEEILHGGYRVVVERVRRRRIERVYFERLEPVTSD